MGTVEHQRIGAAHGIRGEVRVRSFTAAPLDAVGYGPLGTRRLDPGWIARLGASGRACYDAILAMDVRALGESMNECSRAWDAVLPEIFVHPTITIDLREQLAVYAAAYPGAMFSGCGGGYLVVASEEAPLGSAGIVVRTS